MPAIDDILNALPRRDHWGYRIGELPAAEPLALAALALIGHGRDAGPLLEELSKLQGPEGSVGIYEGQTAPHWATSQSVLAWCAALKSAAPPTGEAAQRYRAAVVRACEFLVRLKGKTIPPGDEVSHNTMLVGWPWVESTHSWLEPTAWAFLALKAADMRSHARAEEAVALMLDRLLPGGGCNYGNTIVLGQTLRPHVQPTGFVLLALAGDADDHERVAKSVAWLSQAIDDDMTSGSLAAALLGLAAQRKFPADAMPRLEHALSKPTIKLGAELPRWSLAALAALGEKSPLVTLSRAGAAA